MGTNTDDGFMIESAPPEGSDDPRVFRHIVLALDEAEALNVVQADLPNWRHQIVDSGTDVRAQAARLGLEPGTCRQI